MWELDQKAECWRIDAFDLWYWRRLLRVPWTSRRSNQSILKEINPACSLEGLMLKLKLQFFGHLIWRADSLEKTVMLKRLKAGGGGDDRGQSGWMASSTQLTRVWASSRKWWRTGKPDMLQEWGHKESDMTEQLNNNNKKIKDTNAEISEKRENLWIRPGERPSVLD